MSTSLIGSAANRTTSNVEPKDPNARESARPPLTSNAGLLALAARYIEKKKAAALKFSAGRPAASLNQALQTKGATTKTTYTSPTSKY